MKKFTVKFTENRNSVTFDADTFEPTHCGSIFYTIDIDGMTRAVGSVYSTPEGDIAQITSEVI